VATVIVSDLVPGSLGLGISVLALTFILLVFGEISPKTFAYSSAESWVRRTSGIMGALVAVCRPVSSVLSALSRTAARLTRTADAGEELSHQEILSLIELGRTEGVLGDEAGVTVAFLSLNEKHCGQAMIPRSSAVVLRREWTRDRMKDEITSTPFTRYPLIEGAGEKMLGYVDAREFLAGSDDLLIHDLDTFPETAPLGHVLEQLRRSGAGIGAVFDEYGDWVGIITVEDVLETVVYRKLGEGTALPQGVLREDGGFRVPGSIRLDTLSGLLRRELTARFAETAAGLLEEATGRVPSPGEEIEACGCRFTVLDTDGRRVAALRVVPSGKGGE